MLFDPLNDSWDFFAKLNDQGRNCATLRPRLEEKLLFFFLLWTVDSIKDRLRRPGLRALENR